MKTHSHEASFCCRPENRPCSRAHFHAMTFLRSHHTLTRNHIIIISSRNHHAMTYACHHTLTEIRREGTGGGVGGWVRHRKVPGSKDLLYDQWFGLVERNAVGGRSRKVLLFHLGEARSTNGGKPPPESFSSACDAMSFLTKTSAIEKLAVYRWCSLLSASCKRMRSIAPLCEP